MPILSRQVIQNPTATITTLKAIDPSFASASVLIYCAGLYGNYVWDPNSTRAGDNVDVIVPDILPLVGRWLRTKQQPGFVTITTGTVILGNLPHCIVIDAAIASGQTVTFPDLSLAYNANIGDQVRIINQSSQSVTFNYSNSTNILSGINPLQYLIYYVQTLGSPGVFGLEVAMGTIRTLNSTGGATITTLGTVTTGTWNATVVTGAYGGTGVDNGARTLTYGGNVTFSGAFTTSFTVGANTSLTLPSSGALTSTQGITDSTTARTFALTDAGALISATNAGTFTATIPTNASVPFPIGTPLRVSADGAAGSLVTIAASGGVTLNNAANPTVGSGGYIRFEKTGTDVWKMTACYEEFAQNTTWSGIWASPQTGNSVLVRNMNNCILKIPSVTTTENTVATISMTTALPARFRPTSSSEIVPTVQDGGVNNSGNGTISNAGGVSIAKASYTNFSGSGTGGFRQSTWSWVLT